MHVYSVRHVCERYLGNGKNIFWAFMDLEKTYDSIDGISMWQMLSVYGVGGILFTAVQGIYVDSWSCVMKRTGADGCERFEQTSFVCGIKSTGG